MRRLSDLPLLVILSGVTALAMLVPALYAYHARDLSVARAFFYAAVMTLLLTAMVGVAVSGRRPPPGGLARRRLAALVGAFLLLPLIQAVPFHAALRNAPFLDAWFEMLSCFTTTGATLYDDLPPALHLWRGLAGWLGGLFTLIAAAAILAPLDLGGAEVVSGRVPGQGAATGRADPGQRLVRQSLTVAPAFLALTLALWMGLLMAGESALPGLMIAMGTLSTSGITGQGGLGASDAGLMAEVLVFALLLTALTRRSLPGGVLVDRSRSILSDPELRLAALLLAAVPVALFLRHWLVVLPEGTEGDAPLGGLSAVWGGLFTALSFLTTTGFDSDHWQGTRLWSGLPAPGLILLGLAMVGGGVATAAGGLKLIRVHALMRHGERELDRLIHPSSVGGGGPAARRMREAGAYAAWVFFMLFALCIAVGVAALALAGLEFEPALVLVIAALTTTGQLAAHAGDAPIAYAGLAPTVKLILAGLMVLGRVEVLAILALIAPRGWRA